VNARTASKNIEVEVDKPLGLALGQKPGGGVVITVSATTLSSLPLLRFLPTSTHAFWSSLSLCLNDPPTVVPVQDMDNSTILCLQRKYVIENSEII
jgi:hypothetical protein